MENSRPLMAFMMLRHFNLKSKHHFTVLKLIQMHNSTYSDQLGCTRRALPSQWLDLLPRMVWRAHLHIWQLFSEQTEGQPQPFARVVFTLTVSDLQACNESQSRVRWPGCPPRGTPQCSLEHRCCKWNKHGLRLAQKNRNTMSCNQVTGPNTHTHKHVCDFTDFLFSLLHFYIVAQILWIIWKMN